MPFHSLNVDVSRERFGSHPFLSAGTDSGVGLGGESVALQPFRGGGAFKISGGFLLITASR